MKKEIFYFWMIALVFTACNAEQATQNISSNAVKIFACKPTVINCDTLPKPEPIPLEFEDIKSFKLILGDSGSPIYENHYLKPAKTYPLKQEHIAIKCPGVESVPIAESVELKPLVRKLKLPQTNIVQHPFSPRDNPMSILSYSKLEGMLHNVIIDIRPDDSGCLWVATEGGLTKFDGLNLSHFTVDQGLTSNAIYSSLIDSKKRIWLGLYKNGIDVIEHGTVCHYGQQEGFEDATVLALTEDRNGNIWIGTAGNHFGLWRFDGKKFHKYKVANGSPIVRVEDIIEDSDGNIWIAGLGGVVKYNGSCFEHIPVVEFAPKNDIRCIAEDKRGVMWFGTDGDGLISFDGNTFNALTTNENLLSNTVFCLNVDHEGLLWVGHEKGISLIDGSECKHLTVTAGLPSADIRVIRQDNYNQNWIGTGGGGFAEFNGKLFNNYTNRNGVQGEVVYKIIEDTNHEYWIGSSGGLGKLNGTYCSFYNPNENFAIKDIKAIDEGRNNTIWLASSEGLLIYSHGEFRVINENIGNQDKFKKSIFSVFEDNQGQVWIGTKDGVSMYNLHNIYNYDATDLGFPDKSSDPKMINAGQFKTVCRVYSILQDLEGNMWYLINRYGLVKYDGISFHHYNTTNGLPNKGLQCMAIDKKNRKWIGSETGLMLLEGDSILLFDESNGLSNSNVQALQLDSAGNLWIGTRDGLNKLPSENMNFTKAPNKDLFKKYGYYDGMISIGIGRGSMFVDSKNQLWMGGNNFLTKHYPEQETHLLAPSISLTSLDLFNDKISWGEVLANKDTSISLSNGLVLKGCEFDSVSLWHELPMNASFKYNNNFLTFNFVGATTYQPEQVKYQYMLEGWDESWSGLSSRTSAPYGNLPPGDYTFLVKAMNSSGTWSEPLKYTFSIRPPWFWNIWSKIAYLLFTITTIFAIFRWRTGELRKRQRELEDTVRERTSEIAKKHREITDSINYAERIQRSLMASRQLLDANLPEYFVYFNPKERVSGDFFWACNLTDGKFALACADSTGHGVPGAIMSMLNIAALERAVDGEGLTEPNLILDSARKKVIKTLAQDGSEEGGRDGMDAVLVTLDMAEKKIVAALANMQLWIMGSGEKRTIAPDKMPIGKHDKQDIPFTRHELQLKKGDVVYMFSDGYVDQFGGPNGKKFKYRPFEELLFSIHQLPIKEQQVIIRMHFENWMGDLEQVDDVCVIGIRM